MRAARGLLIAGALLASAPAVAQDCVIDWAVQGETILMAGEVGWDSLDAFYALIDDFPDVTEIVLEQIWGSCDDEVMVELGYAIRDLGFDTYLFADSEIYSGGVDLFLAGVTRRMEQGAILGVHSWSDGVRDGASYPRASAEHDLNRDYIITMLGDDSFYWFTLDAAPAAGMHTMTADEIQRFGLLTEAPLRGN